MEQENILLENCEKSKGKYSHLKTAEKRREYNHKFYENNKGKDIKRVCEHCLGSYTIFNKSHHNKSKKHARGIVVKEAVKDDEKSNTDDKFKLVELKIKLVDNRVKLADLKDRIQKYQDLEKQLEDKIKIEGEIKCI